MSKNISAAFNRTTSLSEVALPDFLKTRLWKEKLVACQPLMDILSVAAEGYIATVEEAVLFVETALDINRIMKKYADEFYAYRSERIPEDVLYACFGGVFIDCVPEKFPHLPESYFRLSQNLDDLKQNPERLLDPRLSPDIRFTHSIESFRDLKLYRDRLRQGNYHPAAARSTATYEQLVPRAKSCFEGGTRLVRDIRLLTHDIDYIVNHHAERFAWYVKTSSEQKEKVLDKNFVFADSNLPDIGRVKTVLKTAYGFYEEKNGEDGYAAYYEFSEKVLCPLSLFCLSFGRRLTEAALCYAIASPVIREAASPEECALSFGVDIAVMAAAASFSADDSSIFDDLPITPSQLDALNGSMALADLIYATNRLFGPHVKPIMMLESLSALHEKLVQTESQGCEGLLVGNYLDAYRKEAAHKYNEVILRGRAAEYLDYYALPEPV